ncbi:hypothetical protein JOB18_034321, partial [Solea senegalensis]
ATDFIRNNPFFGGGRAAQTAALAVRSTSTLTDSNKCAGRRRRNSTPCNRFIATNRNSNAVPCERGRGKIELAVNCSCLGSGEEEKRDGRTHREGQTRTWQRLRPLGERLGFQTLTHTNSRGQTHTCSAQLPPSDKREKPAFT